MRGLYISSELWHLAAIKFKTLGFAAFLKDKASQASNSVADPSARQQTLSRLKYWGAG